MRSARARRSYLAATGYTQEQLAQIGEAAKRIPLFKTANLSVGINLLQKLVKEAAAFLGDAFDIEIVEKHHNLKKGRPFRHRPHARGERERGVLRGEKIHIRAGRAWSARGISARSASTPCAGAPIVGEHEVMFAGEDEILTLSHSARSKKVFAAGAIAAAKFMKGRPAGKYDMQDVLAQ